VNAQNNEFEKLKEEQHYQLITQLKAFRLERSKEDEIKAYYIFNDA